MSVEKRPQDAVPPATAAPTPLRVAAAQAHAVPGEVAGNAVTAARLVHRAADAGARLLVLPELFLSAYHPPTLDRASSQVPADEHGEVDDARLDPLRVAVRDAAVAVLCGAAVRAADGHRYLSTVLARADGSVQEVYRKQYLCGPEERALFAPGARSTVVYLDGWRLGLGTCYDGCFPEHARALALAGAQAYVCSTAYLVGSEHRRDLYYRARALENGMWVVVADAVGGERPWAFGGGSAVYDPEGRPVVTSTAGVEDVVVADLDVAMLGRTRQVHPMLADVQQVTGPPWPVVAVRAT